MIPFLLRPEWIRRNEITLGKRDYFAGAHDVAERQDNIFQAVQDDIPEPQELCTLPPGQRRFK